MNDLYNMNNQFKKKNNIVVSFFKFHHYQNYNIYKYNIFISFSWFLKHVCNTFPKTTLLFKALNGKKAILKHI